MSNTFVRWGRKISSEIDGICRSFNFYINTHRHTFSHTPLVCYSPSLFLKRATVDYLSCDHFSCWLYKLRASKSFRANQASEMPLPPPECIFYRACQYLCEIGLLPTGICSNSGAHYRCLLIVETLKQRCLSMQSYNTSVQIHNIQLQRSALFILFQTWLLKIHFSF